MNYTTSPKPREVVKTAFGCITIASLDEVLEFLSNFDFRVLKGGKFMVWKKGSDEQDADDGQLLGQFCSCADDLFNEEPCQHVRALNCLLVEGLLDFESPESPQAI